MTDLVSRALKANNNEIVEGGSGRMNEIINNLSKFKKLKNIKSKNPIYIKTTSF